MSSTLGLPPIRGKNKIPHEEYLKLQREYWQGYRQSPEGAAKIKANRKKKTPEQRRRSRLRRNASGATRRQERIHERRVRAIEQGVPYTLQGEPPCPTNCKMCGIPFAKEPHSSCATLDRKIPALGYVPENVDWICLGCNSWKERKTLADAEMVAKSDPRGVLLVAYLSRPASFPLPQSPRPSTIFLRSGSTSIVS